MNVDQLLEVLALMLGSKIEKSESEWRYMLAGKVRLIAAVENGEPHGPFTLYYADGQTTWIRGLYRRGIVSNEWQIFTPDGKPMPFTKVA